MAVGRVYSGRNNILLSAGILFVAAGKTWVCVGFMAVQSTAVMPLKPVLIVSSNLLPHIIKVILWA